MDSYKKTPQKSEIHNILVFKLILENKETHIFHCFHVHICFCLSTADCVCQMPVCQDIALLLCVCVGGVLFYEI